jgi:hypothetical protein
MPDAPEILRLFLEMKAAKQKYEERLRFIHDEDIYEMQNYLHQLDYFEEEFPIKHDYVIRMRFDRKDPNKWIAFPKSATFDSGIGISFVLDHLSSCKLI